MKPLFELGQVLTTPGALQLMLDSYIPHAYLLDKHVSGNWGDLSADDKAANDRAVIDRDRILSAYMLNGEKVWVITEWDRSVTTILLPEEY